MSVIHDHLKNHPATFANVVIIAMRMAELAAQDGELVHGAQKLARVKKLVPEIINQLYEEQMITQSEQIKMLDITEIGEHVADVVEGLISVSKSPEFLQIKEEVIACCANLKRKR